jgi:hypothetical protein
LVFVVGYVGSVNRQGPVKVAGFAYQGQGGIKLKIKLRLKKHIGRQKRCQKSPMFCYFS